MSTVTLRPARIEDAPAVAAIWHSGWRDAHLGHVPDALVAARTERSFAERAPQRVGDTVVAVVGADVAGFVMVVGDEVEQVYVSARHRGTGVAAALLAEAERLVEANGHDRAWLAVAVWNARARRFYERNGWTDEGPFDYPAASDQGPIPVPCHRYAKRVHAHMTPDEFRQHGHDVIDWIADYYGRIEQFPVLSRVAPGEVRAALPDAPPEQGEPFDAVLRDLDEVIMPGITHWQHPSFFAYFPANASGPGILGDLLASGLGVQGMLWATSPAATELETHVLDWLRDLLHLPDAFTGNGVIQHTASDAALVALLAALHRASGGAIENHGIGSGRFAVYTSAQTHSSVEKACRVAGLGADALRKVDVDPATQAARPEHLRSLIERDVAEDVTPALVVVSVGATGTGAVDPTRELATIARDAGAWVHVDAAWAGVAAVAPELRWLNDGVELADSYCTNPHKWLLTNFDCDAFWVADRAALLGALSILPEYLRNAATDSGAVIDYRDWHVPLGRRFRALKLWAVIRWYGASGLRRHIRSHVELAQEFASWVAADERFELVAPHPLSLVTFRLREGDDATRALMERVNASGRLYLTHTTVDGAVALRFAIGSPQTRRRHVEAAWAQLSA